MSWCCLVAMCDLLQYSCYTNAIITKVGEKTQRGNTVIYKHAITHSKRETFRPTRTGPKMKFSIKDFFSKCGQIRSFLRIWSHLLNKSLMENFIFCIVTTFFSKTPCYRRGDLIFRFFPLVWLKMNYIIITAWKVSVFGVILVRIFPH